MKHLCIKIITGEEIVGMTESDPQTDEYINLEDPVKVSQGYDPEGNFGLRFSHFMPFSEERLFTFKPKDIILYSKPTVGMIRYYDQYMKQSNEIEESLDSETMADLFDSFHFQSFMKH